MLVIKVLMAEDLKELRKENARFWKDVMLEDINAIEGMQAGRRSPVYNGGNFSPVWINQLINSINGSQIVYLKYENYFNNGSYQAQEKQH